MDEKIDQQAGEKRQRLDRLDGCMMWGFGVPVVALVVAGMIAVVWAWGMEGPVADWMKWVASVGIVTVVGVVTWRVIRTKRG
ncbi:MAG TPA: hypothetical protein VFE58_01695 [Tepidisphaeraceae bacterium]|jgi:hypothetical protein|nr:hypothetical protein [Tepidisphaeraceae bacterium]